MTENQKQALQELVSCNEHFKGYRVVVDYAISLVCAFKTAYGLNKELTDFVEDLYNNKYDY